MIGISIKPTIGIGDALQYSSLPENYFRATGRKLIDVSRPWFFDHNPFVDRDSLPTKTIEMWNFSPTQYEYPNPRKDGKPAVYLSNAEIWCAVHNVPCVMNRPRLYRFEDVPFERRQHILLHTSGISHGEMPEHIVNHIIAKYGRMSLWHVGPRNSRQKDYGLPNIITPTLWNFAELVAKARMFISMDSGPSWISACYPDVITKIVRTKPTDPNDFLNWVPLEVRNIHSHWCDRARSEYNVTEDDIGHTWSYRRI
jgi:hypothetical protein